MITLEVEIGPSVIMLYGTFLKRLWFIKEGFLSWDQYYSDIISEPDPSLIKSELETRNLLLQEVQLRYRMFKILIYFTI